MPGRGEPMSGGKPQSIADKEAEARKDSVLLRYAYLYDSAKGRLLPKDHRKVRPEILEVFGELVEAAAKHKRLTGRHLPILGELGELFAEIMFGIKRHNPMTPGSDGKLGNDLIEVKTITPDKRKQAVQVKRTGNFEKLVVVKISDDFQFAARMVDRRILKEGDGKWLKLSWEAMVVGEKDQKIHQDFPSTQAKDSLKAHRHRHRRAGNYGVGVRPCPR